VCPDPSRLNAAVFHGIFEGDMRSAPIRYC
jgi:hypothetical protein